MELVTIPVAVFNSSEFEGLKTAEKMFLIDLYILFGDCASFTINMERPTEYRQRQCDDVTMFRRVAALVQCGLLAVSLRPTGKQGPGQRIYSFKYTILEG